MRLKSSSGPAPETPEELTQAIEVIRAALKSLPPIEEGSTFWAAPNERRVAGLVLATTAFRAAGGVVVLCQNGYSDQASAPLRTLYEAVLKLSFISLDAEIRAPAFMESVAVTSKKWLNRAREAERLGRGAVFSGLLNDAARIVEIVENLAAASEDAKNWPDIKLFTMASAVGLPYELYSDLCDRVHCGVNASAYLVAESGKQFLPGHDPSDVDGSFVLRIAIALLINMAPAMDLMLGTSTSEAYTDLRSRYIHSGVS